ncbi:MAG: hypothetical protein JJU10_07585 [Idiomarina sp.]|nr:hypothetical protein [Idiomarina sp.]
MSFGQGLTPEHVRELSQWLTPQAFDQTPQALESAAAPEVPASIATDQAVRMVFVTLSDAAGHHAVGSGMALGLAAAATKALSAAREYFKGAVACWKLDVVAESVPIDARALAKNKKVVAEPSVLGVALGSMSQAWLPEESLRYRLVRQDLGIDYAVLAEHLNHRVIAQKPDQGWLFTCESRYISPVTNHRLVRGHAEYIPMSGAVAHERALAGLRYLAGAVREDGSYVYVYQSGPNREPDDYNMVRHAGTTWALLDLFAELPAGPERDQVFENLLRAVKFLRSQVHPLDSRPDHYVMREDGTAKLGGNGLALVALVEYYKHTQDESVIQELRKLANWIVDNQSPEGEFLCHKLELSTGEVSRFLSDYYPGEAILGLMRLYSIDPDDRWKEAAAQGARWLINVRDAEKTIDTIDHDHWLLYGLRAVYADVPEPLFLAHARKLVTAILKTQVGSAEGPAATQADWRGGWYTPPRTTPAACRTEGLMAAIELLTEHGEPEEIPPLLKAVEAGLKFQLQNQIWDEQCMYLAAPERARGGFHSNLQNWHIRIDYVQHSISSLMAYARYMRTK